MDVKPSILDGVPLPDLMPPEVEEENYLNAEYGVRSWLLTRDHKRIGLLYLFTLTGMFILGLSFTFRINSQFASPLYICFLVLP